MARRKFVLIVIPELLSRFEEDTEMLKWDSLDKELIANGGR